MTCNIVIPIMDGCMGLSVLGPADLFNTANQLARQTGRQGVNFIVSLLSENGEPVRTSSGHVLAADGSWKQCSTADVILLPGLGAGSMEQLDEHLKQTRDLREWIRKAADENVLLTASCTGTTLLADAGLLNGKNATTTWWIEPLFREKFPDVQLDVGEILVEDGNLLTAAAGTSSLDLALHVITRVAGRKLARLTARFMVVEGARSQQKPYIVPWHRKSRDTLIEQAESWMFQNLSTNARIDDLAADLGVSSRTLLRRFKLHTGMTPQAYFQQIRMDQIKTRLEDSDQSIAQISDAFGFADENSFRRAFSQATGTSPSRYRKQFRVK